LNFQVTDATASDAQAIIDFMNRVGGESDNLTFGKDEFFIQDPETEAANLRQQKERGGFTLLAWEQRSRKKGGPRLIGLLSVDMGTRARLHHRATMMMAVLKEFWHQGVGTRLMQQACARVENNQAIEVFTLEVRPDNEHALHLYKRFGFEETGVNRGLLKVGDSLHDTILMSRVLHRTQPGDGRVVFYLADVVDAIDSASDSLVWYANLDTAEIAATPTDEYDDWADEDEDAFDPNEAEENWECLPDRYEIDDMRCMRDFARRQDEATCRTLLDVTHRRGAYGRFKDECARRGLLNDYYAYQDLCHRQIAIDWLESHGCLWTEGRSPRVY